MYGTPKTANIGDVNRGSFLKAKAKSGSRSQSLSFEYRQGADQ